MTGDHSSRLSSLRGCCHKETKIRIGMKRSGFADLPLHGGRVPPWLAERMEKLNSDCRKRHRALRGWRVSLPAEGSGSRRSAALWAWTGILREYHFRHGRAETRVESARAELGVSLRRARQTIRGLPTTSRLADERGLDGDALVVYSRLTAKSTTTPSATDSRSTCIHFRGRQGDWAVVQQGMNGQSGLARRYHWHSATVRTFGPPSRIPESRRRDRAISSTWSIAGAAGPGGSARHARERPRRNLSTVKIESCRASRRARGNVDLKRLGAVLATAYERTERLRGLLLVETSARGLSDSGVIAEVVHGAPSRFQIRRVSLLRWAGRTVTRSQFR